MDKKRLFLLIGIFWFVIIFGFIAIKEFTLKTGKEILLKTVPIDPRDLFRGDYVVLRYEISTLDLNSLPSDYADFKENNKIYVALNVVDAYGAPSKVYKNTPDEELFIKGTVRSVRGKTIDVEYGIESYFVPEGKGYDIERRRGSNLDVKVSVDRFGNAVIKSLLIEGKELNFN